MSNVGRKLYGYCNGFFGRGSYDDKRVEAEGYDWIVTRNERGEPEFAYFEDGWLDSKQKLIDKWAEAEEDECRFSI